MDQSGTEAKGYVKKQERIETETGMAESDARRICSALVLPLQQALPLPSPLKGHLIQPRHAPAISLLRHRRRLHPSHWDVRIVRVHRLVLLLVPGRVELGRRSRAAGPRLDDRLPRFLGRVGLAGGGGGLGDFGDAVGVLRTPKKEGER